jgi:hypothetical protein
VARANPVSPSWIGVPARVIGITFLFTLLTFAVSLLLGILGTLGYAHLKQAAPDLTFAYRRIAFPCAIAVGATVLLLSLVMEIRHYRQRKALAGIERVSGQV